MRRLRRRVSLGVGIAAIAALALATPASAAITATTITTPGTSPVYSTFNGDTPNTIALAGTTDSTAPATDKVDLRCFYGSPATSVLVQGGVSLAAGGSFSVPAANLGLIASRECRLRAVPAGSTSNSNVYRGPLMLNSYFGTSKIVGGPNAGTAFNFYLYGQQLGAAADYVSIGAGGFWDSYLFNDAYGRDATVFYANAYLWFGNMDGTGDTRSEIQVDGQNAYASSGAYFLFGRSGPCPPTCDGSRDNAGFPPVTYTFAQDPTNGNVTIHESENLVRCPTGIAYPPTHATCGAFTATGVKVDRTIVQNHNGHVVFVTDAFSSTDGAQHAIDLLYENAQYLNSSKQPNIGYQLAGQSGYAAHAAGETATVPSRPGSIYVKNLHADDGDPSTGQGAITYSVAPSQLLFLSTAASTISNFTMHYAGTVPASGALSYVFGYATEFTTAAVVADSLEILHGFTPCKVPKLKGKTLSQAKAALKTAYCALGTVKKVKSKTVKKGRVISSKPAAGVTKPWGTLVNLKISRGKK
jgi:hypothetical protein